MDGVNVVMLRIVNLWRLAIVIGTAVLTACSSIPTTREALEATQTTPVKVCSALEIEQAVDRLRSAWKQCFAGSPSLNLTAVGNTFAAYRVAKPFVTENKTGDVITLSAEFVPSSAIASAMMGSHTVLLMADFRHTAECNTEVVARGWNAHWHSRAAHTSVWLEKPEDRGAILLCN